MNKKAQLSIIEMIIIGFVIIILIGVFAYAYNLFYTALVSTDLVLAETGFNFTEASMNTVGQINEASLNNINLIGLMILFGMVIGMFINAYFNRNSRPQLFIIFDIVIIIVGYIIAVYLSNVYEMILTGSEFGTFLATNLESASQFILNLPLIIVITGVLIMIITYSGIPRSQKDQVFIGRN